MKYRCRFAVALGLLVAHASAQSGQINPRAGEPTIAGLGSTVDNPNLDFTNFRPVCFEDDDCESMNCEVDGVTVQDLPDGPFYCGAPVGLENCVEVANAANNSNVALFEIQRVDGVCNNLDEGKELDGSLGHLQIRPYNGIPFSLDPELSGAPTSFEAREVSDNLLMELSDIPNQFGTSTILPYMGQFIDHDITLIEFQPPETRITIPGSSPVGFPDLDNDITFELSVAVINSDPILNPNSATSFIDLSQTYGSDAETSFNLRKPGNLARLDFSLAAVRGTNVMRMFLPLASTLMEEGRPVAVAMAPAVANLFAAGDVRANEQVMLMSFQTLFLREHNYWVNRIEAELFPGRECPEETPNGVIPDQCEQIYQLARIVTISEMQKIAFQEYFDAWHNDVDSIDNSLDLTGGYNSSINPNIDILFSTAIYRFGHTAVRSYVADSGPGADDPTSSIFLGAAFFNPNALVTIDDDGIRTVANNGPSGLLLGASRQCSASRDGTISRGIRDNLFRGIVGTDLPPSDLGAFNVERGLDHEIPLYNDIRAYLGLELADTFTDVVTFMAPDALPTPTCYVDDLNEFYGEDQVDNCAPFVCAGYEPAARDGGQMGFTQRAINTDQFQRLLSADRFNVFHAEGVRQEQLELLSDVGVTSGQIRNSPSIFLEVLRRNTFDSADITDESTGSTRASDNPNLLLETPFGQGSLPFFSTSRIQGACCTSQGDTFPTGFCSRDSAVDNTANPQTFTRVELDRCDAINSQAGNGDLGFIAGTMPRGSSMDAYNCDCKLFADVQQTAFISLTVQGTLLLVGADGEVTQAELDRFFELLWADIAREASETYLDVSTRMPAPSVLDIAVGTEPNTLTFPLSCSPTENTEMFMSARGMIGAMIAATYENADSSTNEVLTSDVMSVICLDCPQALNLQFTTGGEEEEATILGFSTAVGGAIIGAIVVVALLIIGCGVRFYMNNKNRQQTFTSGQESV